MHALIEYSKLAKTKKDHCVLWNVCFVDMALKIEIIYFFVGSVVEFGRMLWVFVTSWTPHKVGWYCWFGDAELKAKVLSWNFIFASWCLVLLFTTFEKTVMLAICYVNHLKTEEQLLKQIVWDVRTKILSKRKFKATKWIIILCRIWGTLDGILVWFCCI
jgi:hypothetical protein